MLAIAELPDQRDDIESELDVWQRQRAFLFWSIRSSVAHARPGSAAADDQRELDDLVQQRQPAPIVVRHPEDPAAAPAAVPIRLQPPPPPRPQPTSSSGPPPPPAPTPPHGLRLPRPGAQFPPAKASVLRFFDLDYRFGGPHS